VHPGQVQHRSNLPDKMVVRHRLIEVEFVKQPLLAAAASYHHRSAPASNPARATESRDATAFKRLLQQHRHEATVPMIGASLRSWAWSSGAALAPRTHVHDPQQASVPHVVWAAPGPTRLRRACEPRRTVERFFFVPIPSLPRRTRLRLSKEPAHRRYLGTCPSPISAGFRPIATRQPRHG
jgi:hypothetical protein